MELLLAKGLHINLFKKFGILFFHFYIIIKMFSFAQGQINCEKIRIKSPNMHCRTYAHRTHAHRTCGSSDLCTSDLWAVGIVGCRTCVSADFCTSDLWAVGLVGRRTCDLTPYLQSLFLLINKKLICSYKKNIFIGTFLRNKLTHKLTNSQTDGK